MGIALTMEKNKAIPKGIKTMKWLMEFCSTSHGSVELVEFKYGIWCWAKLLDIMMDNLGRILLIFLLLSFILI
jgi:high-affinity Fe2+/Pb2+ permease